jgi:ATP-dependent Zn protease
MASVWSMGSPGPVLSISEDSSAAARQSAEERAQKIIDYAWTQALETLDRHKSAHAALAAALLERETVEGAEIEAMVASHLPARLQPALAAE